MIPVKVDKTDPTDLYQQVAGEIRRAIAEGEAKPGERLPPAKDLAAVLGVNTNTVLRALRLLRDEGLLEFRRGRGISVAGTPAHGAVVEKARELVPSPAATATGWTNWSRSSKRSPEPRSCQTHDHVAPAMARSGVQCGRGADRGATVCAERRRRLRQRRRQRCLCCGRGREAVAWPRASPHGGSTWT